MRDEEVKEEKGLDRLDYSKFMKKRAKKVKGTLDCVGTKGTKVSKLTPIITKDNVMEILQENPKLMKALQGYLIVGDKGLGDLAAAKVTEILIKPEVSDADALNAAKLGLNMAGKLKNVNLNANMNMVIATREDIEELLND